MCPVAPHLPSVIEALDSLESRKNVLPIIQSVLLISAIVLLSFWVKVLQCIKDRNLILQSSSISLDIGAGNNKALEEEMISMCNSWASILSEATVVANAKLGDRERKRKRFFEESEDEAHYGSTNVLFRNLSFISQLHLRFTVVKEICYDFYVIWKLREMSGEDSSTSFQTLLHKYRNDLTDGLESPPH